MEWASVVQPHNLASNNECWHRFSGYQQALDMLTPLSHTPYELLLAWPQHASSLLTIRVLNLYNIYWVKPTVFRSTSTLWGPLASFIRTYLNNVSVKLSTALCSDADLKWFHLNCSSIDIEDQWLCDNSHHLKHHGWCFIASAIVFVWGDIVDCCGEAIGLLHSWHFRGSISKAFQ